MMELEKLFNEILLQLKEGSKNIKDLNFANIRLKYRKSQF